MSKPRKSRMTEDTSANVDTGKHLPCHAAWLRPIGSQPSPLRPLRHGSDPRRRILEGKRFRGILSSGAACAPRPCTPRAIQSGVAKSQFRSNQNDSSPGLFRRPRRQESDANSLARFGREPVITSGATAEDHDAYDGEYCVAGQTNTSHEDERTQWRSIDVEFTLEAATHCQKSFRP